jgi:predicted nuclease of restriction endonuclease-like (RecB) superfamily
MNGMLPADYVTTLERIKRFVHQARYTAQHRVNTELLRLYWQIGDTLNDRQRNAAWGANTVGRLANDLRTEFPSMKGFSRANLFYMRRVAEAWPDPNQFVQQAAGQIPWTHLTLIIDKFDDPRLRDWYATKSATDGWSRAVLGHQIATRLHERQGVAPSNYSAALGRADSDLAQEITKDPYALGFLAVDSDVSEVELEGRLVERIIETLRELGPGDWDAAESKLALLV